MPKSPSIRGFLIFYKTLRSHTKFSCILGFLKWQSHFESQTTQWAQQCVNFSVWIQPLLSRTVLVNDELTKWKVCIYHNKGRLKSFLILTAIRQEPAEELLGNCPENKKYKNKLKLKKWD